MIKRPMALPGVWFRWIWAISSISLIEYFTPPLYSEESPSPIIPQTWQGHQFLLGWFYMQCIAFSIWIPMNRHLPKHLWVVQAALYFGFFIVATFGCNFSTRGEYFLMMCLGVDILMMGMRPPLLIRVALTALAIVLAGIGLAYYAAFVPILAALLISNLVSGFQLMRGSKNIDAGGALRGQ